MPGPDCIAGSTKARQRHYVGRCSFIAPEGFTLQEQASSSVNAVGDCGQARIEGKPPLTMTLSSSNIHPDIPLYSERADDMKPEAYPVSITLTTLPASDISDPLAYLQQSSKAFQAQPINYQQHFCRDEPFGDYPAACSQCSLQTNFKIFLLNFCWLIDHELVTVTITVSESGVEKGWADLRSFAGTVKL